MRGLIMGTEIRQDLISPVERTSYEADQALTQQLYSEFSLQMVVDSSKKPTLADVIIFYLYDRAHGRCDLPPYVSGTLLNADTHEALYHVPSHPLPLPA